MVRPKRRVRLAEDGRAKVAAIAYGSPTSARAKGATMHKSTSGSWLAPASAIAVVIAVTPLPLVAQTATPPQAIREFSLPELAPVVSPKVGKAFNEAIAALNAGRFAKARDAIGELRLDRLSSFERGQAELVLFNVAYAEKDFAVARQHLFNALESRGLDKQATAAAQEQLKRLDERITTAPPQ
jgi:hypothetical protein